MSREMEIEQRARLRSALVSAAREEEPSSAFLASLSAIAAPKAPDATVSGSGGHVATGGMARLETASATGTATAGAVATGWKVFALLLTLGAAGGGVALLEQRQPSNVAPSAAAAAPLLDEVVAATPAPSLPTPPSAEAEPISVADLPSVKPSPVARAVARASTPPSEPAPPPARLADETRAVTEVRAAMRAGNTAEALRLLDAYHAEFPSGVLEEEARILHIETLAMAGNRAEAARRAKRFLVERPSSHYAPRVRALETSLSTPE